jgi:UDP-N-acetylglucosamine--N-acetylmuramyl-(pentapeptide) pyrophosphoryl-undecaprenol N-acetylglucosamine transferase
MRLALAGGGTGGHVHPGLHLLADPVVSAGVSDVVWFQSGRAVEDHAFDGAHLDVSVERVTLKLEPEGGGAPSLRGLALKTGPAVRVARRVLRERECEVLLGLGGFTSLPAVLAARSLRIPVALFEINALPGKATRALAPFAHRVLHAWREGSAPGGRHGWTGPPLEQIFLGEPVDPSAARVAEGFEPEAPLLVVLGGSQGARALNRFIVRHVDLFARRGIGILHQVGPGRLHEGAFERSGYRAVEYVDDVHRALSAATVVLCRGGASTLVEVGAARRPAVVVPYPHHPDRHQERNAGQLGDGVQVVHEETLGPAVARELAELCGADGAGERERMASALEGAVPRDGAARIWFELRALAGRSTRAETPQRA